MLKHKLTKILLLTGYPGDKPVATMWESKGKITYLEGEALCNMI